MPYVLLWIESEKEAKRFEEDAAEYPDSPLLTPTQENTVYFSIDNSLFLTTRKPPDGCG